MGTARGSLRALRRTAECALLLWAGIPAPHQLPQLSTLPHPPAAWQAEITWRVQFAVGTAIALGLTAYRWLRLQARAARCMPAAPPLCCRRR